MIAVASPQRQIPLLQVDERVAAESPIPGDHGRALDLLGEPRTAPAGEGAP